MSIFGFAVDYTNPFWEIVSMLLGTRFLCLNSPACHFVVAKRTKITYVNFYRAKNAFDKLREFATEHVKNNPDELDNPTLSQVISFAEYFVLELEESYSYFSIPRNIEDFIKGEDIKNLFYDLDHLESIIPGVRLQIGLLKAYVYYLIATGLERISINKCNMPINKGIPNTYMQEAKEILIYYEIEPAEPNKREAVKRGEYLDEEVVPGEGQLVLALRGLDPLPERYIPGDVEKAPD